MSDMTGAMNATTEVPVRIIEIKRGRVLVECHGKRNWLKAGDVLKVEGKLRWSHDND